MTRRDLAGIVLVALLANAIPLLFIAWSQPGYLLDYRRNGNPDAVHYVRLGENLLTNGVYSRQPEPPYRPDVLRTPVYPLLAGIVQAGLGIIWPLYLVQALLSAATAGLVYGIGTAAFGRDAGRLAGCIYAADLMLATLNVQAMSEPVFIFLTTSAVFLYLRRLRLPAPATLRAAVGRHAPVGVVLGLAALTRPAGLYLPLVLGVVEVAVAARERSGRRVVGAVALVGAAALTVAPWVIRNDLVHGVRRLTTADTIILLYFTAAGAYQVEHGIDRETAQRRIADEFGLTSLARTTNFWLAGEEVAAMDARQRRAAVSILAAHPWALARSTVAGLAKASVSHNTAELAEASDRHWTGPGLARVVRGRLDGVRDALRLNHPVLSAVAGWQVLVAVATIPLAALGLLTGLAAPSTRATTLALLAVIGYGMLTAAALGIDAHWRQRAPILPFACVFTGFGLRRLAPR